MRGAQCGQHCAGGAYIGPSYGPQIRDGTNTHNNQYGGCGEIRINHYTCQTSGWCHGMMCP